MAAVSAGVVVRILGGMVDDFELGQLVPVHDEPPDDEQLIRSESDFEIHALAGQVRAWRKGGRDEEAIRALLRELAPEYAEVRFPGPRTWLTPGEAKLFVELGDAEWVDFDSIEDAVEAWQVDGRPRL